MRFKVYYIMFTRSNDLFYAIIERNGKLFDVSTSGGIGITQYRNHSENGVKYINEKFCYLQTKTFGSLDEFIHDLKAAERPTISKNVLLIDYGFFE